MQATATLQKLELGEILTLEHNKESVKKYSLNSYNNIDLSLSKSISDSTPTSRFNERLDCAPCSRFNRSDHILQWMDTLLDGLSSTVTTPSGYMSHKLNLGAPNADFLSMNHVPTVNSSSVSLWNWFLPVSCKGILDCFFMVLFWLAYLYWYTYIGTRLFVNGMWDILGRGVVDHVS